MNQMTYSLRMDKSLKQDFDEICEELGLTATTAINVFARMLVKERKIPFIISTKEADIERNKALLNFESMKDDVKRSSFGRLTDVKVNDLIKKARSSK